MHTIILSNLILFPLGELSLTDETRLTEQERKLFW